MSIASYGFGASGGGGTPPATPPWGDDPTPGDGQVVLHLAGLAGVAVYVRWRLSRKGEEWSEESELLKVIGPGDVAVPGLTNLLPYEFIAYAKEGETCSYWTRPAYATPDDGSTAASGPLALPAEYLRELLAQSLTWQGWCEAEGPEAVKDHIYKVAVPGSGAAVRSKRPFALIDQGADWKLEKVAGGSKNYFLGSGDLLLMFEAEVPEDLAGNDKHDLAQDWFMNLVGLICDEMMALAGEGSYLAVTRFALQDGPSRSAKKVHHTEGDYFQVLFAVEWGI